MNKKEIKEVQENLLKRIFQWYREVTFFSESEKNRFEHDLREYLSKVE